MNEWTRRTEPFSELSSQVAVSIKKKDPALVAAVEVQVMEQTPPVSTLWIMSEVHQWCDKCVSVVGDTLLFFLVNIPGDAGGSNAEQSMAGPGPMPLLNGSSI